MAAPLRLVASFVATVGAAFASPPAGLATALEYLRDQRSYSWEVINGDPGPVAHQVQTRRGAITTVQQNLAPSVKGQIDRNGDMLIVREWSDGLKLETVIAADGTMVTNTPEGWLTDREILTAQAEERMRSQGLTARFLWLRRADRPNVRRPDQELLPFLKSDGPFDLTGDSYIAYKGRRPDPTTEPRREDADPPIEERITMNVRNGMIRDYEVKIEATRRATRARIAVPISEQRIVILTYVPVNRIDIPDEARAKLKAARGGKSAASSAK